MQSWACNNSFVILKQPSDGNCLYHALGTLVGLQQQEVREQLVCYAQQTWKEWAIWDPEGLELPGFVLETSTPGSWGGMVQIQAFALLHQLHISVFKEEQMLVQAGNSWHPQRSLLYCSASGNKGQCDHYDVLQEVRASTRHASLPSSPAVPLEVTAIKTTSQRTWMGKLSTFEQLRVLTINVSGSKDALAWAMNQDYHVILVQEHKADRIRLQHWQSMIARGAWHGVWQPALKTPKGGYSGGVAIIVPKSLPIFRGSSEYSHRWIRASVPWTRTKSLQVFLCLWRRQRA